MPHVVMTRGIFFVWFYDLKQTANFCVQITKCFLRKSINFAPGLINHIL